MCNFVKLFVDGSQAVSLDQTKPQHGIFHIMPELMSTSQVAQYLGVSRKTLYNMLNSGRFPVEPVLENPRKWSKTAIDSWISKKSAA